jgi:hypothetical protein
LGITDNYIEVVITVAEGAERRSYEAGTAEKDEDKTEVDILW